MKTNKSNKENLDFARLSRALLKLDPGALAALSAREGPEGRSVAAGLHEFLRMVLERALSLLWAADGYELKLHSRASGKALRCHWKIHNLVELLAWALVRIPRKMRGLGELVLCEADAKIVYLPRRQEQSGDRPSLDDLANVATAILVPDFDAIRDAPGPKGCAVSLCALIGNILEIKPNLLIRIYHDSPEAADEAFERDPNGQALAGLSALLMRCLFHRKMIADSQQDAGTVFGFKIYRDNDYEGADGASGANLAALLMAGWFAGGERTVAFVA